MDKKAGERRWGGAREGAGRPVGSTKEISNQRSQHQVRAFEEEWLVIKEFSKLVKTSGNLEKCREFVKSFSTK